ncbi:unnamed protein product [Lymnaea stagnalis]|uniref:Uncharacterized protein n=1 Tax=Lymnaea stagnalis TaxID=6523 RepID=A0AAV2HJ47_LYMST
MMQLVLVMLTLVWYVGGLDFSPPLSDTYVSLGDPFWWTCSVLRPNPLDAVTFTWRRSDGDLKSDQNVIVYSNGTLYLKQVFEASLGTYTCIAELRGTYDESSASLLAAYINGSVSVAPGNQSVVSSGMAVMDCRVDTRPVPTFTWIKEGLVLTESSRTKITQVDAGHSMLQIINVTYSDVGRYVCNVSSRTLPQYVSSGAALLRVYGAPMITSTPLSQSVPIGYNVTLLCPATSDPRSQLKWTFQAQGSNSQVDLVASPSGVSINELSGTLELHNLRQDNSGTYFCTWSNQYGTDAEQASLVVDGQPRSPIIIRRPADATVTEGGSLTLTCSGDGNPKPTVTWSRDGSQLDGRLAVVADNGTLILANVSRSDMGTVTCQWTNSAGHAEATAFVNVYFRPYFTVIPQGLTVSEGSSFTLHCDAIGNPSRVITWVVPSDPNSNISVSDLSNKNEVVYPNGSLLVRTSSPYLKGIFLCFASNSVGSVRTTATVTVTGPPYFIVRPVSQGVVQGDTVVLDCQVSGDPPATVTWYYRYMVSPSIESTDVAQLKQSLTSADSLPVQNLTTVTPGVTSRYSWQDSTSLKISAVAETDAGLYICMAANSLGSRFELVTLLVKKPPTLMAGPRNRSVIIGDDVSLDCYSVGIPVPSQIWQFNQVKLTLNSRMRIDSNGTLFIDKILEAEIGLYTCTAVNIAGQASASGLLTLSRSPYFTAQPANTTTVEWSNVSLGCRGRSPASMIVTWYASNAAGDTAQIIGQTVVDPTSNRTAPTPGRETGNVARHSSIQISGQGDLVVTCVDRVDAGWYVCTLTNVDGRVISEPSFLAVHYMPTNISVAVPDVVYSGKSAVLSCTASGEPAPKISWVTPLKTEVSGSSGRGMMISALELDDGTVQSKLDIWNAEVVQHGGEWGCKACNAVGCRLQNASLAISDTKAIVRAITALEYGSEFGIACETTGLPTASVTYSWGGNDVGSVDGHRVSGDVMYVVKDKVKSQYTCQANNVLGYTPATLMTPSVVMPTKVSPGSSSLSVTMTSKFAMPHLMPNRILLQFKAQESSDWRNVSFYLSNDMNDYLLVRRGVLTNDVHMSCGNETESSNPSESPKNPPNLNVTIESNDADFTYTMEVVVENLQPSTSYNIRAALFNILGSGSFSPVMPAATLAAAPSQVKKIDVEVVNRTAHVTWLHPDPLNGRPDDTSITVTLMDSSLNLLSEVSVSVLDSPQVMFANLTVGDYVVQLYAANRQTNTRSNATRVTFQVRDQPPGYVPEISGLRALDAYSIQVNWTLPSSPQILSPPVTGFSINITLESQDLDKPGSFRVVDISSANVSTWIERSLQEHQKYAVRVASKNSAGVGPYSDAQSVTTPYDQFSESPLGDTKVGYNFSWKLLAIVLICICAALIVITAAVILTHQLKLARRKSVNLEAHPESSPSGAAEHGSDGWEPTADMSRERQLLHRERSPKKGDRVQGHQNEGFVLY